MCRTFIICIYFRFYDSVLNMFEMENDGEGNRPDFAMDTNETCSIQVDINNRV